MNKDTWIASAIYGRVGAAIWSLSAVIFGLSTEQAEAGNLAVTSILGGLGAILAIVSKVREGKK
jgi:hypothetical protein